MNGEMWPGVILRYHLPRGEGTSNSTAVQRLGQSKPTVLNDPPVREAIERQMSAGLFVRSVIFMCLGGCGDVVELRRGVLNGVVIRDLQQQREETVINESRSHTQRHKKSVFGKQQEGNNLLPVRQFC